MIISFRLNKNNDNDLINELKKYENNNLSQLIRGILRNTLLGRDSRIDDIDMFEVDEIDVNTNVNVHTHTILENRNKLDDISSNSNKSKLKWNFPS